MTVFEENVKQLREMHRDYGKRTMFTGQRVSASQVRLSGAPEGKTWVRRDDASREQTAVIGYYGAANHEVWVGPDANGNDTLLGATDDTIRKFGVVAVNAAMTPPKPAELNKDILPNENLQQFRVHPFAADSLVVRIEPGFYYAPDGTLNATEITTQDVASSVPSASGDFNRYRWVKVSLDTTDGTFTFTDGTPSVAITDMTMPALAGITVPVGEIPLYGILLRTGQTFFDDPKTQFVRLDTLIQSMPQVRYGDAEAVTIASDTITLTTASHYVVSAQSSTTDDLDTITGGIEGQSIRLTAATGHTITLRDGVDNLTLPDGVDVALDDTKYVDLILRGADWYAIGGGGGSTLEVENSDDSVSVTPTTKIKFGSGITVTDNGGGEALVEGVGGGATIWPGKGRLIYHKTIATDDDFDTNDADDDGRTGIPQTGVHLHGMIIGRSSSNNARAVNMFANGDTTATNYSSEIANGINASVSSARADTARIGDSSPNGVTFPAVIHFTIPLYTKTTFQKSAQAFGGHRDSASSQTVLMLDWSWENTAAISRLQFQVGTDVSFETSSELFLWVDGEISVGAADLDIASISPVTPVTADYLVGGDVSNTENTFKATIEDVLELATYEMTSTSTGNIDNLDIGDAPLVELRMNNASTATIRGMVGSGKGGQTVKIFSVGAGNVELAHQNGGSSANNRLINAVTGMSTPLAAGFGTATYVYDATTLRWRLQSHNQGVTIAYTPTWTVSGGGNSLGNGTLTGLYLITGNLIFGQIALTAGSTTNPGTGAFSFSLPTAVSLAAGSGTHRDTGTAQYNLAVVNASSTTLALIAYNAQVTHAVPFALGNTDAATFSFYGVAT